MWFLFLACAPPDGALLSTDLPTRIQDTAVPPSSTQPDPLRGFSWVEPGALAVMPFPRDLDLIAAQGVETLVSLTTTPLDPTQLDDAGLETLHLPVVDFTAPSMDQMQVFVDTVSHGIESGRPTGVHCIAGLGRSGTMAAAWLVSEGMTAQEAIDEIRLRRPGSIETAVQEQSLFEFETLLAN